MTTIQSKPLQSDTNNKAISPLKIGATAALASGAFSSGLIAADKYCPNLTRKIVYYANFSSPPKGAILEPVLKNVSFKTKAIGVAAFAAIAGVYSAVSSYFSASKK